VIASLRDALAACGGSGSESLTFGQRPNSLDFIGYCLYSSLSNFLSLSYSSNSSFEYVSINVSFDHFLVPTLSDLIFPLTFGDYFAERLLSDEALFNRFALLNPTITDFGLSAEDKSRLFVSGWAINECPEAYSSSFTEDFRSK